MKRKGFIILGAVVILVFVAVLIGRLRSKNEEGVISLSGNVEVTESNMGFKMPGRIVELAVDEGQTVKLGAVLARLDNAELTSFVAQSRAGLQEASTRLAELKAGSRPQEIGQAGANAAAQEAELTRVKKDYERAERLYKEGAMSASNFDSAKSAYEARKALHRGSAEVLSLVKEGPRKEQIEAAEHRVQQLKAALAVSEERLGDTILYAPTNGVILRKNVELGETVGAGTPVFTVGDLENPWVKVYVKETQLGLVKLGQKAQVKTDTYKHKTYEGAVTYISSEAEFTPKNVQTQEERVKLVFGVKVRVKNVNQELKPGMPADVKILLQR